MRTSYDQCRISEGRVKGRSISALWGLGLLATGIAWQVLALLTLRQLQIIGGDGWLPEALLRLNPRFNTPILLVIAQSALTLLALALSQVVNLAEGPRTGPGADVAHRQCPKCGAAGLIHQEGCDLCTACGYSKCT